MPKVIKFLASEKGAQKKKKGYMCKVHYSPGFYIAIKMFMGLRKKSLLISNTDLIQTSLTKANHEILISQLLSTADTILPSHALLTIEPGLYSGSLKHSDSCSRKENESDHSVSLTSYKMLRSNCLLVFPNLHRNLPFFLCPDSQKSMV